MGSQEKHICRQFLNCRLQQEPCCSSHAPLQEHDDQDDQQDGAYTAADARAAVVPAAASPEEEKQDKDQKEQAHYIFLSTVSISSPSRRSRFTMPTNDARSL